MKMLYDSDDFVVVHINATEAGDLNKHNAGMPQRDGFEVVDKRSNKTVYLDGRFAKVFEDQLERWKRETPDQSEVEAVLDSYCELAQYPLVIH